MQAWVPVPSVNEADWFKSSEAHGPPTPSPHSSRAMRNTTRASCMRSGTDASRGDRGDQPNLHAGSRARSRQAGAGRWRSPRPIANSTGLDRADPDRRHREGDSDKIVAGTTTDIDKARKIYEWVVENTFRNAAMRGCGVGDIAAMLRSGNLGGKCADLNALYVGLARAAGLPARDVYGIRVAPSKFGYRSLGAGSANVTKAQHCRAEVYLAGLGWVPVDPADVRKVVLEEPPGESRASAIRRSWPRARRCSAHGRATGSPTISRTISRCPAPRGRRSSS